MICNSLKKEAHLFKLPASLDARFKVPSTLPLVIRGTLRTVSAPICRKCRQSWYCKQLQTKRSVGRRHSRIQGLGCESIDDSHLSLRSLQQTVSELSTASPAPVSVKGKLPMWVCMLTSSVLSSKKNSRLPSLDTSATLQHVEAEMYHFHPYGLVGKRAAPKSSSPGSPHTVIVHAVLFDQVLSEHPG